MASLPAKMKILLILTEDVEKLILNFSRSAAFHMETRVSLKYFVKGCSNNPLELNIKKDTIKNSLDFQLTKFNITNITLIDKKIHCFSITKTGKKRKETKYGSFRNNNN